ncbi:hypothetical protein NDU88_011450 [Pleurodeles waltl]|uniref:Uncharacterized protein n=1 Tax=Pleurodeles waltl TaxID=8319 RepID=A0AAV7Q4S2_PLEWA|nr:hypothetical protein NDU88_011450 [Pleurodeles waltl]
MNEAVRHNEETDLVKLPPKNVKERNQARYGTLASPFSDSASKRDGCQGNEKARACEEQRRATTQGAHKIKIMPIRLKRKSPSRKNRHTPAPAPQKNKTISGARSKHN